MPASYTDLIHLCGHGHGGVKSESCGLIACIAKSLKIFTFY